jgi:outer membrane protein
LPEDNSRFFRRTKVKAKRAVLPIAFLLLTGGLLLVWAGEASSQEGKIGYVDSMRLRAEFKEFQDAQAELDDDVKAWQDELATMELEIDSLKEDLDNTKLLLSEGKKKEKQDQLKAVELNYQNLTNDIFGPGGRAERKNAELTRPILDKINQVLEKVATEENYIMIFDSVNANIAYAKKNLDLTDIVLEELKKLE